MGKLRDELQRVRFRCGECGHRFECAPIRVEDAPGDAWHPWHYFADCPMCDEEAEQDPGQRSLLKAWACATGPKTPAGKAASAANLDGHPTPEEAQRTRFNGLKHGLNARTATYWPARPGKYPDCDGCPYFDGCAETTACQRRVDLYFKHHLAFDTGDPSLLTELNSDLHANLRSIVNMMILDVIRDGATVRSPAWYYDKDGGFHLARGGGTDDEGEEAAEGVEQIMELRAHPMLKLIGDWVAKLGLNLSDMGMTVKVQQEAEEARGYLDATRQNRQSLEAFTSAQRDQMTQLQGLIARSRENASRDPVLIEHQQQGGDDA